MSKLIKRERCIKASALVFGACVTFVAAFVTLGTTASAAPVSIVGYDIAQTPRSGFGCWFHDYGGTVVNTGRTVSGSRTSMAITCPTWCVISRREPAISCRETRQEC
jgi:hypothetical protein